MTSMTKKFLFVPMAEHVRSVKVKKTILQNESFLRDQTEMCSSPYQAFRGSVSQPEINHQAAYHSWAKVGVFCSNVLCVVQLSKLTNWVKDECQTLKT